MYCKESKGYSRSRCLKDFVAVAAMLTIASMSNDTLAQVRLPKLIGDGMVVQRNAVIPVWGWANVGDEITVELAGSRSTVVAGEDSVWEASLPAMDAGGPFTMSISAGAATLEVKNILVGDVWIASGQSNMEFALQDATDADAEIAAATDPEIRHFKVPRSYAWEPEVELAGGEWVVSSPQTAGDFTAVGYFFAQELRKHVDVPIGIINSTWGGSSIQAWMGAAAQGMSDREQRGLEAATEAKKLAMIENLRSKLGALPRKDAGLVDGVAVWADHDLDDSSWDKIPVPGLWEEAGYDGMDGIAWYRTTFALTPAEAAKGARLSLGTIDDSDISWVNGSEVGRMTMAYNQPRLYDVQPSVLRPGVNTLAVRVEDTGGGGGIYGDPALIYLEIGGEKRAITGFWKFRPAVVEVRVDNRHKTPTLLYNRMLRPLFHVPVRGITWYQGETNATEADSFRYRDLLKAMVTEWRRGWNDDELPFLVVQLPNWLPVKPQPSESDWAMVRESELKVLDLPKTGLAVTIDVGDAVNLHPPDKKPVGIRLANAARAIAYDQELVYSGPIYRSANVVDGRVVVSFDYVGSGLVAKGGTLHEFAIAGPDKQFMWANAEIEGDHVVVWHPAIHQPAAVRYAWADNPEHANLYNEEGLPASPFRADEW